VTGELIPPSPAEIEGRSQAAQSRWRPYPEYKDSGIEWLGEIPAGWDVKRLKFLTRCLDGQRIPLNSEERGEMQGDIPYWGANGILDRVDRWLFDEPLVLLGEDGAPFFDKNKNVAFFVSDKVWVNNHIHALRPNQAIKPKLLMHCLNCVDYKIFIDGSTRDKLTQSDMNSIQIPIIQSISEQENIIKYLDRETAKIDALIEKKRRLISLLEEKRAAVISHAVTKGLDPDAPMRDSGVEWLGEIPTGWNLLQLRRVINKFVDYRGATPKKVPNGIPLITAKNIKMNKIDFELSQEFIREEDYNSWMVRGLPEIGDVLVTTEAPLGESAQIVDPNIALAQRIILLKADKVRITNDYLKYYFASSSGKSELWSRATGSTALGIKASRFKETLLTVPPIKEQQMITELLDRETLKSYKLVSKINEQINKLQEYRTALISAAVTGKIDVREASL
jgi:type I restriction enzyme S subunit